MNQGTLRNAFSRAVHKVARILSAGRSSEEKINALKLSLSESKRFLEDRPPVVGIFLSGATLLLTGKARKAAAERLNIELPVYPIEEKALALLVEEGLLRIDPARLEAAVDLLTKAGFGTTAELLAEDLLPQDNQDDE
jgi:hypothetical protein